MREKFDLSENDDANNKESLEEEGIVLPDVDIENSATLFLPGTDTVQEDAGSYLRDTGQTTNQTNS